MAQTVSVTVLQIGDGPALPTSQVIPIGVDTIDAVFSTQTQDGGGTPNANSRFISDPNIAAQVYSRIDQNMGTGRRKRMLFCSDKVADINTNSNA